MPERRRLGLTLRNTSRTAWEEPASPREHPTAPRTQRHATPPPAQAYRARTPKSEWPTPAAQTLARDPDSRLAKAARNTACCALRPRDAPPSPSEERAGRAHGHGFGRRRGRRGAIAWSSGRTGRVGEDGADDHAGLHVCGPNAALVCGTGDRAALGGGGGQDGDAVHRRADLTRAGRDGLCGVDGAVSGDTGDGVDARAVAGVRGGAVEW